MDSIEHSRTPAHLWVVGFLATVWNAFGAYDYVMTRARDTDYLRSMMPDVDPQALLAWIDSFPLFAQIGWGMGIWFGLAGSLLLLLRNRWAVTAFALSFAGAVLSLGYQILAAPPLEGAQGPMVELMPFVIIAIGAALLYYSWTQQKKGLLR